MLKTYLLVFMVLFAFLFIGFAVSSKSIENPSAKTAENDILSKQLTSFDYAKLAS